MSVRRDTFYNAAGSILPLVVSLVVLPPYIRVVGEARYGVLVILWTILGYAGLLDLGITQAVTNRIALLRGAGAAQRAEVFWTAFALNGAVGVVGTFVFAALAAVLFEHVVHVPGAFAHEVQQAMPMIVAALPVLLVSSVCVGALNGREEFLAQNAVSTGSAVFAQLAPLAVALTVGPELPGLVAAAVGVRIATSVVLLAVCRTRLPLRGRPRIRFAYARELFAYGRWVSITTVVGPLFTTLDRVVIGALAGASAVTHYAVPYSIAARLNILPSAMGLALFPRFTGLEPEASKRLLFRSTRLVVLTMLPAALAMIWVLHPFLRVWMGAAFADRSARPGEWIAIGVWSAVVGYPAYTAIPARGRPDLIAKLWSMETIPYVVCLILAVRQWGALGAATVVALRNAVDTLLLLRVARVDARIWPLLGQSALLLALGFAVTRYAPPLTLGWFAGVSVVSALVARWLWREEPTALRSALRRLHGRAVEQAAS